MSTNNITDIISEYIDYNGKHWATGDNETSLSSTNFGASDTTDGIKNTYLNTGECYAFSLFFSSLLFGSSPEIFKEGDSSTGNRVTNDNWMKYTGDLSSFSLQPGDVIRTSYYADGYWQEHSAVIWYIDNNNIVHVAEVWGSEPYHNLIHFGNHNGGYGDIDTVDNLLPTLVFVYRYNGEAITPDTGGDDSGTTTEPETETVTVSFYDDLPENGGKYIDSKTYDVGGTYKSVGFPSPTTPTGYKFDHWWFPAPNGYGYVETWSPVTKDITELYAHWDRDTVEVTFYDDLEVNGGQVVDTRDYLVGLKYNAEYLKNIDNTFPDPTNFPKTGYSFDSWHTDTGGYVEHYSYVKRDRTELYANWTPNTYDVTLYNNDGTNVSNTESFVFGGTYGEKLGALEDRYGYTFKEWNTSPDGEGDSYDKNSKIEAKNLDLYAIWEEKEVNVTYNYGYDVNGTVKTGEGTLNYGDTYAEATGTNVPNMTGLEHPTGGYEFAGWHHDVVESSDKVVMDADHTLTAMWEPKKIYVTFRPDDTNSFKYPISPIQVRYGEKFNQLPVPDPVLPYEFIGWTLSEDGESTGTYVDDFEDVYFTEDITLMANWSSRRFTRFIYENENGEETTKGCSQMYGYAYRGVPTIPEKDGYTSKWVFSEEGSLYNGSEFFPGMLVIPDHPNTIRAVYTAVTTD